MHRHPRLPINHYVKPNRITIVPININGHASRPEIISERLLKPFNMAQGDPRYIDLVKMEFPKLLKSAILERGPFVNIFIESETVELKVAYESRHTVIIDINYKCSSDKRKILIKGALEQDLYKTALFPTPFTVYVQYCDRNFHKGELNTDLEQAMLWLTDYFPVKNLRMYV